ncbi:iron-sulfur cluster assembly accessory protein [Candidatus Poribacteria bacterium]|nr:iron-sulfur cluster assembly accessory protein [Candidatus Poribacteria bacterium]
MKLTDQAIDKVASLIRNSQKDTPDLDLFLRIAVQPGGCSGLRYQTYFDYDEKEEDQVIAYKTFDLRIDKMSWPYISESTLDYVETIEKVGFTINNPMAQGSCACGDSFS